MLVSHRKRFIYTKTAKTASTSVEVYFEPWCLAPGEWSFSDAREEHVGPEGIIGYRGTEPGSRTWVNHLSAKRIRRQLGADTWDRYFKFCVVRNPFDLLISAFWFRRARGRLEVAENADDVTAFRDWLAEEIPVIGRHQYMIEDRFALDHYIVYGRLMAGIEAVCTRLEVPFEPEKVPRLKTQHRDRSLPIGAYYTRALKQRVEDAYALEIEKFGFAFPASEERLETR